LPPVRSYFRAAWDRREFAWEMARTEMRAQHLDTTFGRLWLILNPLLLAFVYFVLVEILRRGNHRPPHQLQHLIAGIFLYTFMAGTIREGARTVVGGGRLVLNTAFPRILLPISEALDHFMRFLPMLGLYAVVHVATGLPINANTLYVVPLVVLTACIGVGAALFVSALQVYFRDLKQFLPYMLRLWLYLTPILYYANRIPDKYHFLIWINPIGAIFASWSDVLMFGRAPSAQMMGVSVAWAALFLLVGTVFFMSREREFAVRL